MVRCRVMLFLAGLACLCIIPAYAEDQKGSGQGKSPDRDVAKGLAVENPLKGVIKHQTADPKGGGKAGDPMSPPAANPPAVNQPRRDVGKTIFIEPPAKAIVKDGSAPFDPNANPKVAPGLVKWHKDFATACAAAKMSGKPVMLFQMLGKLDDQFC